MSDFVEIPASFTGDPGGRRIAALLGAQRLAELWESRRRLFGRLVIALSIPMGWLLHRGLGVTGQNAHLVLTLWVLALFGLVGCALAAAHAQQQVETLLGQAGGHRIEAEP